MATSDDKLKLLASTGDGAEIDGNARVRVLLAGVEKGIRRAIDFIGGANVTIGVVEDADDEVLQVTIAAVAGALGAVTDEQVGAAASATNYTPTGSHVEGHLAGIDTAIGTKQASSAKTTALAALTWAADKLPYFTSASAVATTTFTAFGRTLAALADAAAARTALALGALAVKDTIATGDIDANAVTLAKLQALGANKLLGAITAGDPVEVDCTAAGRALIDDASAATQRATLGVDIEEIDWLIETPTAKTYAMVGKAKYAGTINSLYRKTSAGSITAKVQINGVDVTGLTALSCTTTAQEASAAGANTVVAGDRITLVLSAASSPADLELTLKITR